MLQGPINGTNKNEHRPTHHRNGLSEVKKEPCKVDQINNGSPYYGSNYANKVL